MEFTIGFPVTKYCVLGKRNFVLYPLTKIDLLEPLLGVERTIDTLGHYHKHISAPGNPRDAQTNGILVEFWWNFIFPAGVRYTNQIQNRSHGIPFLGFQNVY